MDEDAQLRADKVWQTLKPGFERLAEGITALYTVLGVPRTCRHINDLKHAEYAGVGIGFVPPEARELLESLFAGHHIGLHKGNGPLGRGAYYVLLDDGRFDLKRLAALERDIEAQTEKKMREAPSPEEVEAAKTEPVLETQVARVEGLVAPAHKMPEKPKLRPAEVADLVDAFNHATQDMSLAEALSYLAQAVVFFELPAISRHELLRTVEMMRDAESNA